MTFWNRTSRNPDSNPGSHLVEMLVLAKVVLSKHSLVTRHFLVRAKGEVFVLLCLFFCLFGQRFLSNPRADSRHILHAGVAWVWTCLLPFWGLAAHGGRKKRQMKFSLLWESMGNFSILAVFERYLSNACTDPHQILFVYGQCLPTCPLPLWCPSAPGGRG